MPNDTSKSPYILLNDRLPTTYTSRLLGRIVADPLWPPDEYAPTLSTPIFITPPQHPPDELLETTDLDAQLTLRAHTARTASGRLGKILGLTRDAGRSSSGALAGKRVITRNLVQQRAVFERVAGAAAPPAGRDEVLALLSRPGGRRRGYMVVGMKSIVDATVGETRAAVRKVGVEWEAPVAEIVGAVALAGAGVPAAAVGVVPEVVNPGGAGGRTFAGEWSKKFTMEGEAVFAVRYRVVRLKGGRVWSRGKMEAEYGRVHRDATGHGVFAGRDDEAEDEEDDEEEADYEEEEEEEQEDSKENDRYGEGETGVVFGGTKLSKRFVMDHQLQE
ncbi:hypothetical protein MMC11_007600 [Xylographa trunciseda]|nr:hypothetical protein [Xylographa trunciseda]